MLTPRQNGGKERPDGGVALVGFMGAGKTTVGSALAARLGWPFVDLDAVAEERYGPISAQVARDGWAAFREREREITRAVCADAANVVATGGGTWIDAEARALLAAHRRTVWLDAPLAVCAARVGAGGGRPLWDEEVAARFAARRPLYALAERTVDATRAVEELVDELAAWVAR